ncbi:CDP-glycerol glycerophosphotransferase family protein [bacterium]|nr:CDP-glycerol glycerophosphotransferase family protein [candidate division CSSED10-310 bacterium]
MKNIYIVISQGNVYRDLVRLGMIRHLLDLRSDVRIILLTQANDVPDVIRETLHPRLLLRRHEICETAGTAGRLINRRIRTNRKWFTRALYAAEKCLAVAPDHLEPLFSTYPPSLVVSTHPRIIWEYDVITYARKNGIRTAGNVKSWDNVLRGLVANPEFLSVWNKRNFEEARDNLHYPDSRLRMVGSCAFDRYFTPGVIRDREVFWRSKGLDPGKPIVLFGTAGSFAADWDETFMMDVLLNLRRVQHELRNMQIVCRLHPISHLEYFLPYAEAPGVILSHGSYVPTLGWCMTRDEVDDMANMLHHADAVITPASTLSIEAPIFDTPTIVTLFSTVRRERHARDMKRWWLNRHFRIIDDRKWLPLVRTEDELAEAIVTALKNPGDYSEGRRALVDEYITFTDGKSYQRLADYLYEIA